MKIKRFVDTDMRHVLRRVREEQGPDAVILSNRRVDDGVEVIAAVDYDEALIQQAMGSAPSSSAARPVTVKSHTLKKNNSRSGTGKAASSANSETHNTDGVKVTAADLKADDSKVRASTAPTTRKSKIGAGKTGARKTSAASDLDYQHTELQTLRSDIGEMRGMLETQLSGLIWQDTARHSPMRAQVLRNLIKLGIGPDVAQIISNQLKPITNARELWRAPLLALAKAIPVVDDPLLGDGGIAALVGPTGVGKTTTIAKMASRYAMRFGANEIALISADAHRVGAQEHLSTFANILGVNVYPAEDITALENLIDQLSDKRLVLIDTEGTSQRDINITARLAAYGKNEERVHFYLTLAATCQEAGLDEIVRVFNRVPLSGAIITKIDEAAQLGCVLGTLIRHDLHAAFLTDGQRVPDDFHAAARKRLWLMNKAVESLRSGKFTLDEDMMMERFGTVGAAHA